MPTMIPLTCSYCGRDFERTLSRYEPNAVDHYCNMDCYSQALAQRHQPDPDKRITLVCDQCGKQYERLKSDYKRRGGKQAFCSPECYAIWRSGAGDSRTCKVCGTTKSLNEFREIPRGDKIYHSHTCIDCHNVQQVKKRRQEPEQQRRYDRRSYKKHRERVIQRKIQLNAVRRAQQYGAPEIVLVTREEIIERDGPVCYLCGQDLDPHEIFIDHVVPLSRGGTHTPDNLRVCCRPCNSRKGSKLLSEIDLESLKPLAKTCSHCGETKPIEEFSTAAHTFRKECKPCAASLMRQQRSGRRQITVVDALLEIYRCNECGEEWTPIQENGLENIRWYWRCPNGCNHDGNRWNPGERTCLHCGEVKRIKDFTGRGKHRHSKCRACSASLARQSRAVQRNLTIVDPVAEIYRCNACGAEWHPTLAPGKKHMRGWWACPNGCNA